MHQAISLFWTVVQVLGGIAVVVGTLVAASTWFAKKWIERDFARDLESHKADLKKAGDKEVEELKAQLSRESARELEALKHDLTAQLGRSSKILDREFEVLPKAWEALNSALGAALNVCKPVQNYPNIRFVPEAHREDYYKQHELPVFVIERLLKLEGFPLQKEFFKHIRSKRLRDAMILVNDARNLLIASSIAIHPNTFDAMLDLLNAAKSAVEAALEKHHDEAPASVDETAVNHLLENAEKLRSVAEELARARMWS